VSILPNLIEKIIFLLKVGGERKNF